MIYSRKSKEQLVKDNSEKVKIIGYLNHAASFIASAKSLYYSNFDLLVHDDIEDFFGQFDVFANEVIENIDQSHQWSIIEFDKLAQNKRSDYMKNSQEVAMIIKETAKSKKNHNW